MPSDVAARVKAERLSQGLPPVVSDPAVLARLAALVAGKRNGAPVEERRSDPTDSIVAAPRRRDDRDEG
jgi:hypothetical protein